MQRPVTIDPRYHDAVVFDLDGGGAGADAETLARRLTQAGIATAVCSSSGDGARAARAACHRLPADPGRSVVVADGTAGVEQARQGGFAVVIGVDRTGHAGELLDSGADVAVAGLAEIAVRTGDKRMSELPDALQSSQQARRPFVCLDYDGTLSEIVPDPDTATLVDGAAPALRHLAAHCPVAILSGRDLADIRSRVGLADIWYAGSHGFELTGPDGSHHQYDAAESAVPVLAAAAAELHRDLEPIPGLRVEHKRFAVAVHYRNVAPGSVADVIAAAHRLGQRHGLRITNGRKVVELRPDIDWDKGTALHWIRDRVDESAELSPIYIGDDLTDEDAFDAIASEGVGIVVRHGEDGGRPTAATFTLDGPAEVVAFLRRLADRLAHLQ